VKRATHRNHGRKLDGTGRRTKRGCLSKSCEWHSSVARIYEGSLRRRKTGKPSPLATKEPTRAVDADDGRYRGERVREARLRGRIR